MFKRPLAIAAIGAASLGTVAIPEVASAHSTPWSKSFVGSWSNCSARTDWAMYAFRQTGHYAYVNRYCVRSAPCCYDSSIRFYHSESTYND